LHQAAAEMDIDLALSWCLGSSVRDVQAGRRAGCRTILIDTPSHHRPTGSSLFQASAAPDYRAVNIKEAVNIIKKHLRSAAAVKVQAPPAVVHAEAPPPVHQEPVAAQEPAALAEEPAALAEEPLREPEIQEPQAQVAPPQPEIPIVEPRPEPAVAPVAAEPQEPIAMQTTPEVSDLPKESEPIVEPPKPKRRTIRLPELEQPEQQVPPEPQAAAGRTEELLNSILTQLKAMQREEMFGEFSVMRLVAGVVQIIVLFCVLVMIWLLMSPQKQDSSFFMALGFAVIFQLMALTFYVMHGRR